jgi:tagatose 6-phosphate kinase
MSHEPVSPFGAPRGTTPGAILCVTPSPAVDRTARVQRLVLGQPLRPREVVALAGGKGVNAARAAARMGSRVVTTGIAGGHAGRWLVDALAREGLEPRFAGAAAETRTTYVTVDAGGRSVLVYEPGVPATRAEFDAFLALLEDELLPRAAWVILAGGMPAGVGPAAAAELVAACRRAGRPVLLDSSGASLASGVDAGPDLVKVGRRP